MKKLLSLFVGIGLIVSLSMTAGAQTVANKLLSAPSRATLVNPGDTVTNTATVYQKVAAINGYASVLTFQFVITKISGTVGGSVVLSGTLDGVNYVAIGSAVTPTDVASQTASFVLTAHSYIGYRIGYTGATTQVSRINSYWIARKPG